MLVYFSIIRYNLRGMIDIKGPVSPDMLFRGLFIASSLKLYFMGSKPQLVYSMVVWHYQRKIGLLSAVGDGGINF